MGFPFVSPQSLEGAIDQFSIGEVGTRRADAALCGFIGTTYPVFNRDCRTRTWSEDIEPANIEFRTVLPIPT
jgi:hypothetical protein